MEQELAGTPLPCKAAGERALLRSTYDAMFPRLSEKFPDAFPPAVFTWDAMLWARGVFDTRCVTVPFPGGRDVTCLVPLVDMCNHDFCAQLSKPRLAPRAAAGSRGGGTVLEFRTMAAIPQGASGPPPPPPPRTNRTRRVPHPVLIGHAASLTPYRRGALRCLGRLARPRVRARARARRRLSERRAVSARR